MACSVVADGGAPARQPETRSGLSGRLPPLAMACSSPCAASMAREVSVQTAGADARGLPSYRVFCGR